MKRIDFLKLVGLGAVLPYCNSLFSSILLDKNEFSKKLFGHSFFWGVTTSAHQTEGASNIDGKSENIWNRFEKKRGKISDYSNASVSCDFYHNYDEDLELLKSLNVNNFRLSISWPRILPDGVGDINEKGVEFYNKVIDKCLQLGIEPWVTLYHWDLPQILEDKGGWTNRDILDWFSNYVNVCVKLFGARIKHWIVLNEPAAFTTLGYFTGMHAPGRRGINSFLASVHHAMMCQAEGGRIIRKHLPNAHIGTALSCSYIEPSRNTDCHKRAVKRMDVLLNRLFIEPTLGMGYPMEELPLLKKIEKYIKPGDAQKLIFDFDFIGLQNYFRLIIKPGIVPYIWANRVKPNNDNAEFTEMGWEVYPEGIYKIIKQFAKYPIKEIIITENGAAFKDEVLNDKVADIKRITYIENYLKFILQAKKDGVNVTGYFAWTFIDNFEWSFGYRPRFGMVYNDFETQKRTIKDSGFWFKNFLKQSI